MTLTRKLALFALIILGQGYPIDTLLEKAFPELKNADSEYTAVKFLGGRDYDGRSKRDVGDCFTDVMSFSVTVDGSEVTFDLHENTNIDMNKPIYLWKDEVLVRQLIPIIKVSKCFHDLSKDAAIGVTYRRLQDGSCKYFLEGSFSAAGGVCVIHPADDATSTENHVVKLVDSTINFNSDYIIHPDSLPVRKRSPKLHRGKRQAIVHQVELFFVADSLLYDFWFDRSTSNTAAGKRTEALQSILQYTAYTLNGIDLRYRNIIDTDIQIRVLYAGMFVSEISTTSPFSTTISSNNPADPDRPFVDAEASLVALESWTVTNAANIAPNDHVMLLSKADFTDMGSTGVIGLAFVRATCTANSVSIIEDDFDFITTETAAHELGHSLGAEHDGMLGPTGNLCSGTDSFIMAAILGLTNPGTLLNPWLFSSCSVDYFKLYFTMLNADNNNCLLAQAPGFDPTELDNLLVEQPGQFYSIDDTCRFTVGEGSLFCRELYNMDYSGVCTQALCKLTTSNNCTPIRPGRGTSCGDGKWCIDGLCTPDASAPGAPAVLDECPLGDSPVDVALLSCADTGTTAVQRCYVASIFRQCCLTCITAQGPDPDCYWGDRIPLICMAVIPSQCYSSTFLSNCCGTCADLEKPFQIGCEFGDMIPNCDAGSCGTFSAAELANCCETCQQFETTPVPTTTELTTMQETTTMEITTIPETTMEITTIPETTTMEPETTTPITVACPNGNLDPVCPFIRKADCYLNEATCCGFCLPLKDTSQTGCEYGDRILTCDAATCVSPTPAELTDCCETCGQSVTVTTEAPVIDCPNGNLDPVCPFINQADCYINEAACCGFCLPLKDISQTGCEYGDRILTCTAATCVSPTPAELMNCCGTCGTCGQSGPVPPPIVCPNGNLDPVCPFIQKADCYLNEATCCGFCLPLKDTSQTDCEYGDRKLDCLAAECMTATPSRLAECCQTCP